MDKHPFLSQRIIIPAACTAFAGLWALSDSAPQGNFASTEQTRRAHSVATPGGGEILAHTNIRYDPAVIENDGDGYTNKCLQTGKAVLRFSAASVEITDGDANGPWVGIPLSTLPNVVQAACNRDRDGVVWTAGEYVSLANN